jgi:hypothetical protein
MSDRPLEFASAASVLADLTEENAIGTVYDLLEEVDNLRAERNVAQLQREQLAAANSSLESEVHRLLAELEAAHAKNGVLVNRLLGNH